MTVSLSVIMPVYNVAAYLPACLDSLVAQTLQPTEIIAVDDGSTDECPAILQTYQQKLPQLRIIRQENQGLSGARNTGIEAATGEYIHFLDSDDFLVADAYALMLAEMQKDDRLDMLLFNATYHFEGRREDYLIYRDRSDSSVMSGAEWLVYCLAEKKFMLHMVWLHLYRRQFMLENRFQFIPKRIHEDVVWTTQSLLVAKQVRYLNASLVFYRIPVRNFSLDVRDEKYANLIESSALNALESLKIANSIHSRDLSRLLRDQAIDGGMSVFHKLEKIASHEVKAHLLLFLWRKSFFGSLFQASDNLASKRKLLSKMIRALLVNVAVILSITVRRLVK